MSSIATEDGTIVLASSPHSTSDIPIAPVDAIVQLYSQYEVDILKQKHKDELRDMEKDHNKFLNNILYAHKIEVRRIKTKHSVEIENIRTTYGKGCRKIDSRITKTSGTVGRQKKKVSLDECLLYFYLWLLFIAIVALLVHEPAKLRDPLIRILIMMTFILAIASWARIPIPHTLVEPESDLFSHCLELVCCCLALVGCALITVVWIEVFAPGLVVSKLGCVLNGVLTM